MRAIVLSCAVAVAATVVVGVAAPANAAATLGHVSGNLIKNGRAEAGPGSTDGSTVPVPSWTLTTGTTFTAVQYGASGGFPTTTDPAPTDRGANFLAGGSGEDQETATQTIDLTKFKPGIDAGISSYVLSGWLGGFSSQDDAAFLEVDWKSKTGSLLGTSTIGPVTAADRNDVTGLFHRKLTGSVPVKARTAYVQLSLSRAEGSYNDGYADDLSLTIKTPTIG